MTEPHATLRTLAELCGIATGYWDIGGTWRDTPDATHRYLLHAMRVIDRVAADDAALEHALQREREAPWRQALPPVRVLYEHEVSGIELTLPGDGLSQPLRWRIRCENGEALHGEATPADMQLAGEAGGGGGATYGELDGRALERRWLDLPALPLGYHALTVTGDAIASDGATAALIVAPRRCHDDAGTRTWGPAVQLYALRSRRNAGTGDFADLATVCRQFGELGAGLVGVNPLHALFPHDPEQASPYSPSSRIFLNPHYIALDQVPGYETLSAAERPDESQLDALRDATFIDWSAVEALRTPVLVALHERFARAPEPQRYAFERWREGAGEALARFALFEALRERNAASDTEATCAWWDWPDGLDDPESPAAQAAASALADRVDYHAWLQWLANDQLETAAAAGDAAGLAVGLYRDLAVGTAAGGSDAWAAQDSYLRSVGVGAPPDDFSTSGQNWGLPPLDPRALQRQGYAPFAEMLRANMHASGAIRIDHVMGLARLFWIPAGASSADGAYVRYPLDDMLAVLALESRRAGCTVIGEDLGTVPEGFRETLAEAGVLSYKLMYFEKDYDGDQRFLSPSDYAPASLVGANTHDLPTLAGWWALRDIALRDSLGLTPSDEMVAQQRSERQADKRRLLEALDRAGRLPEGVTVDGAAEAVMDDALVAAIHGFLASAPSRLLAVNLEDLVGEVEQMNLPGTDRDLYPNWRRRLPLMLETLPDASGVRASVAAVAAERPALS